jgi:hypothetical protein
VEQDFVVPSPGGLYQLRLFRAPSMKFDSKLKGTLWIDDVRITRLSDAPHRTGNSTLETSE